MPHPGGDYLTLSRTSPGFYVSAVQVLKTMWEKEKLLMTSNFSFSHTVFYPFDKLSTIFIKLKIVVCKLFQFGRVLKTVVWERVKSQSLSSSHSLSLLCTIKDANMHNYTNVFTISHEIKVNESRYASCSSASVYPKVFPLPIFFGIMQSYDIKCRFLFDSIDHFYHFCPIKIVHQRYSVSFKTKHAVRIERIQN